MEFKPFDVPSSYYKTLKRAHGGIFWWYVSWAFNFFFERHNLERQSPEETLVEQKKDYGNNISISKPKQSNPKLSPLFIGTLTVVAMLTLPIIVGVLRKKR